MAARIDPAVAELQSKCGLKPAACRKALKAHDNDVDAALGALIDAGEVTPDSLDPETVSDELFERAARKQKLEMYAKIASPGAGLFGQLGSLAKSLGLSKSMDSKIAAAQEQMFGGKTPEQMLADDERLAEEKFRKLKRSAS
jgi:hypothetical protein